jgi:hypothetical protein
LATKFCSSIYEGTAPRYAPEGSQPTSKPVAPFKFTGSIPEGRRPLVIHFPRRRPKMLP